MANPFDQFDSTPAQPAPQTFTVGTPKPVKQTPPSGYRFRSDGTLEAIPGGPADPNKDAPTIGTSSLSGDAYLKTLDPGTANLVKALAEGRKSFPSGSALRAPYWQEMLTHLSNYDPGFDEVNYTGRSATRRDFTSGKAANNIRALNTAIGHLGHLDEQISGTASHGFTPLNAVENAGLRMFGDPGPTNFDATVSALAGELTAVYRGAGGAEADIQRYIQQLNPNASAAQKEGTIRNIVGLLKSRLDALNDQYRQGMGTTAQPLQLLDPQAQLIVQHLGGFDAAGAPDQNNPGAPLPPNGGPPPPGGPGGIDHTNRGNLEMSGQGATARTEDVPQASALIDAMVVGNVPYADAVRQFRSRFPDAVPFSPDQYKSALAYHHQHPNENGGYGSVTRSVPLSPTQQLLNNVASSPVGTFAGEMANGATAGLPVALAGNQGKFAEALMQQQNPNAALAGDIVGSTAGMLGGEAALGRAGIKAGLGRELLANDIYGGVRGAAESPDHPVKGAFEGVGGATLGTLGGNALVRGGAAALRGVSNASVNALAQQGVGPMTVGQIVGKSGMTGNLVKRAEDTLSGFRGVGDMIQARRAEGYRSFNSAAFNQALKPINGNVQGAVGEDAMAAAHEQVSRAFDDALKGKTVIPDGQFIMSARGPLERLARNPRVGPEIVDAIEQSTAGLFDESTGALSGENMQSFLDALRQIRQGYKNDPLYVHLIKPSLKGLEGAVEGMFTRQAPEVMPKFNAAKAAYRRVSTLADAVNAGKNTDGIFTPAQLGSADRANAKKYDGAISAASGNSPFFDLQRAAQNVLPGKVPDSGTAGRAAFLARGAGGASLATGGALLGYLGGDTKSGAEGGLGLTGLLALAYTKGGQARLAKILLSRSPAAKAAAEKILMLAAPVNAVGAAVAQPNQ